MEYFAASFYKSLQDYLDTVVINNTTISNVIFSKFNGSIHDESKYLHSDIQKNIEETMNITLSFSFTCMFPIEYNIIGKTREEVVEYTKKIIPMMGSYIQYIYFLYPSLDIAKPMRIYIYLCNMKKSLPNKNDTLSPLNINTGYTLFGPNIHDEITIYRKEEVLKVLLHEITHYLKIDLIDIPPVIHEKLKMIFKTKTDLHIQESITDMWACFINSLYYSIFDSSSSTYKKYMKKVRWSIGHERDFILQQARKIAIFQGVCDTTEQYIHEKTHVISYYIIKAIMFITFHRYISDYRLLNNRSYFLKHIIQDVEKQYSTICHTGLRMSSLETSDKMKTI